ncbi:MAG: YdcH family protein [Pseudomonadota bacterium]
MSLGAHLHELRKKHQALDTQVEAAQQSPGIDDLTIRDLKKEKLRLKEEIRRLEG